MIIMLTEMIVINKQLNEEDKELGEIEKIVQILDQKIRPAIAKDGGDIVKIQRWNS